MEPRPRQAGNASVASEWIARRAGPIKGVSVGLIVLAVLLLMRVLPLDRVMEDLKSWIVSLGVWGAVVLGLCYVAAVLLFLPGSVLTIAAGAIYGLLKGTIIVSIASTTGAALAFLIARYLARERVARRIRRSPKFQMMDRAIGEQGWKIVALLRLSPVVPFNLQNYLYGLTAIRFWPCVLASWLAMLPGTFMYVYLGSVGSAAVKAAAESDSKASWGIWTLRIVGLLATVAVTLYVTHIARKTMQEKTTIDETDDPLRNHQPSDTEDQLASKTQARGAMAMFGLALIVVGAAVWAYTQQETVQNYLEHFLSTP